VSEYSSGRFGLRPDNVFDSESIFAAAPDRVAGKSRAL